MLATILRHALSTATAATLLLAPAAAQAQEGLFPADQFGRSDLAMPQSIVHMAPESVLGASAFFEAIDDYAPADRIRKLARPVGRLDILLPGGMSTCTASLLPGGYLITNHHCIPGDGTHGQVQEASLLMGYLREGETTGMSRYTVDTTPVETSARLDYAIVKVHGDPAATWGTVEIDPRDPGAGESLMVIHHPAGRPKHVTRGGCRSAHPNPIVGDDIRHRCDTLGGSSGSPIFSDVDGKVIGLHFAGSLAPGRHQYNSAKRMSSIMATSQVLQRIMDTRGTSPTPRPDPRPPRPTRPAVDTAQVAATITALPDGGSDRWDHDVFTALVGSFDLDGDGTLNTLTELQGIDCRVWKAIDDGVKQRWPGLYTTYGFDPGAEWVGHVLGIASGIRRSAGQAILRCGLANASGPTPGTATGSSSSATAAVSTSRQTGADPAAAIAGLPTTDDWQRSAGRILADHYDANGSSHLDTRAEVQSVPCGVLKAIDARVRVKWSSGLAVAYGFKPGLIWLGSLFSFDESVRADAFARLEACGVTRAPSTGGSRASTTVTRTTPATTRAPAATSDVLDSLLTLSPTDEAFAAKARKVLVPAYDTDGSGRIDHAGEVDAIDCRVWRTLDSSVRRKWDGNGLYVIYGFGEKYIWVGSALGFAESQRSRGMAAIDRCGLKR